MSAAPVLRFVWAAAPVKAAETARTSEPIETLAFYRKYTERLLREYMQKSMEMGRTPSVLGNTVFRGRCSSSKPHSFEEGTNFVIDIDRCLALLDKYSQGLVARIALQEYSQGEVALLTGQSIRAVMRRYTAAIDTLTGLLLKRHLLLVNPGKRCQGGNFR